MNQLPIVHYSDKWPTGLKSSNEISEELGIEVERITDLANSGFMPHFRLEGGEPLFKVGEVKTWCAQNLMFREDGRPLPPRIGIIIERTGDPVAGSVPRELAAVPSLMDITNYDLGPGIYFLCQDGEVIYIGQSIRPLSRIATHSSEKTFDRVFFLKLPRSDLDLIEGSLIRTLKPSGNGNGPRPTVMPDERILARYFDEGGSNGIHDTVKNLSKVSE